MRQNPVGEPAATAAWNLETPRRRSSFQVCEHTRGLAEAEVAAPSDEVGPELFDQLRQADPSCPTGHVPDLRLEFIEGFWRDAPLAPVI